MANRCALTNQIETLSGALSAATYFDANWNNPVTALNDASLGYNNAISTDTGSANNYLVTCPFGSPSSYNPGMPVDFIPANTNTGASTITVSPLTAASILDAGGAPLVAGAIQAGILTHLIYIAGAFRLLWTAIPKTFYSNPVVTVAGTTTINCFSSPLVAICFDATGAPSGATLTINVTNVAQGAHFDVQIYTNTSGQFFKWSGTDNVGNSITEIKALYTFGTTLTSSQVNLISSGDAAATSLIYTGAYMRDSAGAGTSRLRFSATFN